MFFSGGATELVCSNNLWNKQTFKRWTSWHTQAIVLVSSLLYNGVLIRPKTFIIDQSSKRSVSVKDWKPERRSDKTSEKQVAEARASFTKFFFHGCEVALTSHICYPIRLVFHQHLNSHVAYPGIPPEPSNHTRGQFLHLPSYPLLRLLWSKSDNKVTRKRILDQYHTGTSLSLTALR